MNELAALPELLAIAGKVGGVEAVRALAKAYGGKRTWIPKKAGDHHPLVVAAGRKAANAIMRHYGGEQVQFPKGKAALTRLIIAEMADLSANKIAAALGVTYRQAQRLKKQGGNSGAPKPRKAAGDPRQLDIEDILKRA